MAEDEPKEFRYGPLPERYEEWIALCKRTGIPQRQVLHRLIDFVLDQDETTQAMILKIVYPTVELVALTILKMGLNRQERRTAAIVAERKPDGSIILRVDRRDPDYDADRYGPGGRTAFMVPDVARDWERYEQAEEIDYELRIESILPAMAEALLDLSGGSGIPINDLLNRLRRETEEQAVASKGETSENRPPSKPSPRPRGPLPKIPGVMTGEDLAKRGRQAAKKQPKPGEE